MCAALQYTLSTNKQQQRQPADQEKDEEIAALMAEVGDLRTKLAAMSPESDGSPQGCAAVAEAIPRVLMLLCLTQ